MPDRSPGWSSDEIVALLERTELFEGLDRADLRLVTGIVEGMSREAEEAIFREGDPGDAFYLVVSGAVEVTRRDADGEASRLGVRRSGESFGEMALLSGGPRAVTATAVEPTDLMIIRRHAFRELLGGDSLALRLMGVLSGRLRAKSIRAASSDSLLDLGSTTREEALTVSRLMHTGLLPLDAPRVEGFDVAAGTTTERSGRGGSVWDWLRLADGRVALLTLDVRQQGFPPAHHLGVVRAVLRAVAREVTGLPELLARTNDAMAQAAVHGLEQFVEVGVLVPRNGSFGWGSAGRVPGGVIRRDGDFEPFSAHGPPLGMMEGFRYGEQTLEVGAGDTAFFLSHASRGLFMGAADLMTRLAGRPAGDVVGTMHGAIRKAQGDDRTETSVVYARKH